MEDYYSAFLQRAADVTILDKNGRRTAAIHIGGVAIECLLKHMILTSVQKDAIKDWYDGTEKTEDYGHTYKNPGHDYDEALRCLNTLRHRMKRLPAVWAWLDVVEEPDGHFIDMRYSGKEPEEEKYTRWYRSYLSLKGWLETTGMEIVHKKMVNKKG
jgi:hypothetical protein